MTEEPARGPQQAGVVTLAPDQLDADGQAGLPPQQRQADRAELRDDVKKGQPLGQIHFLNAPERDPLMVRAKTAGVLYCRRAPGRVEKGDTLAVLAKPARSL